MENQLEFQLWKPEKCEACVIPEAPPESPKSVVDAVNASSRSMAKILAMGLACDQTRAFNMVHTPGTSIAGPAAPKLHAFITHKYRVTDGLVPDRNGVILASPTTVIPPPPGIAAASAGTARSTGGQ